MVFAYVHTNATWLHVLHKWKSRAWRVTATELSNQYPRCQWGCVGTISTSEPSKLTDVKWQAFTEAVLPSFLSLLFSLAHGHARRPRTATTLHPFSRSSLCCFDVAGGVVSKCVCYSVQHTKAVCEIPRWIPTPYRGNRLHRALINQAKNFWNTTLGTVKTSPQSNKLKHPVGRWEKIK